MLCDTIENYLRKLITKQLDMGTGLNARQDQHMVTALRATCNQH